MPKWRPLFASRASPPRTSPSAARSSSLRKRCHVADVPDDPEVLSSVAASISDGALIEWDKLARQVTGEDDSVLNELQVLERIAKFHQRAQEGGAANIPAAADHGATDPRGWGHFLLPGPLGRGPFRT